MRTIVNAVCYKSKTLANGECPIMLCIYKEGKRKYQSLGISVRPTLWDFKKNRPKMKCPQKEKIEALINSKIADIQETVLTMESQNRGFTPSSIIEEQKKKYKQASVEEFFLQTIKQLREDGKFGNKRFYHRSYNSIKNFCQGNLDIPFCAIDQDWLIHYEKWMRNRNNKETSISIAFRTLRSLYNKAIAQHCARKSDYPFDEFKVSKFDVRTSKRSITKTDIFNIYHAEDTTLSRSPYFKLSKDIFMFSYLCGGINFVDIANLRAKNISDGRLCYVRQKTGKSIRIGMPVLAREIIEKYKGECNGYLFPIFDEHIHITPVQKQNRIHKMLAKINKHLGRIGESLGLTMPLTTYVARHSFATVLKKSGVDIAMISEMLGHSDLSTTQIYLDSFDDEQIDKAMENLL